MASDRKAPLVSLGPFLGLTTTPVGPYITPGHASATSSANPNRYSGALTCELGRNQIVNLALSGTGSVVTALAPYVSSPTDEQIVVQANKSGAYSLFLYDNAAGTQQFIDYGSSTDNVQFDQSLQYGNVLYLNSNRQYSSAQPGSTFLWHYPQPNGTVQGYSVSASTAGTLAPQYYYYAFTQVVSGAGGTFTQETTELGADVIANVAPPTNLPYYANVVGSGGSVNIQGTFAGTNVDGSTYTTNVYRQSAGQPVWYLLVNLTTNTTYNDTTSDLTLSANTQLTFRRDPPPIQGNNLPAICVHKERTWAFTIVDNALDGFLPQCQLLYSNLGRPWEFDYVNNVILVGNSATPNNVISYQSTYGDLPVALVSLSSILVCLKTRSIWQITGNDQSSFVATQVSSTPGCRARQSVAVGSIGQTIAMFWLSDQGVFVFDGSTPLRIDENVRATIRSISLADRVAAVGMYADLTYYLSFPNAGFTLAYFTPTGEWFRLPYATPYAFSVSANPRMYGLTTGVNEITAVRNGTNYIDAWRAGSEADLGSPQTVTWTGPTSDCGNPAAEKVVSHIILVAPAGQPTTTATVTLTIDGTPWTSPPFTLGVVTRNICEVPAFNNQDRGLLLQLSVTFTTVPGGTSPTVIYGVAAYGETGRMLTLPQ